MIANKKTKNSPLLIASLAILVVAGLIGVFVIFVVQMRDEARRSSAIGRLAQLSFALHNYYYRHETLPPLCLRDDGGEPLHSWRTLLLPEIEKGDVFDQLDLSQSWNSPHNRSVMEKASEFTWSAFTRDGNRDSPGLTHLMALVGPDSLWDPATGLPKGPLEQHPKAVLLISVPTSNVEVMAPRDITQRELIARVEEGQEILYVTADRDTYGAVQVEDGKPKFVPRR
jgi:hypothetical protein